MDNIFANLRARMLGGMVFHDEMTKYFRFLNLKGYERVHRHHYDEETEGYAKLCCYYMEHRNKLIPIKPMDRPDVIPENWYNAKRQDVDKGTRQSGVKSALEKWVKWEKDTKAIYQDAYLSLIEMGEPAAAEFVMCYVKDVDEELKDAERKHLTLESVGYDIAYIMADQ